MPRYDDFEGRSVLVTGAGSGIGRATAQAFARQGARIAVADSDEENAAETARLIRHDGGEAHVIVVNVAESAAVDRMAEALRMSFGGLDYAVNSAGVTESNGPLEDKTEALFDRLADVNFKGTWLCNQAELRLMRPAGRGAIVNISSTAGTVGMPDLPIYSGTKHAVTGLTRALGAALAKTGIRVNAIGPGTVATPMILDFIARLGGDTTIQDEIVAKHPMGRMGRPEEIAEAALWLCSDASSFVTGHLLMVDGGFSAQ